MSKTLFIEGQWVTGEGSYFESNSPASYQICWQGEAASISQVEQAVKSAKNAFLQWQMKSFAERLSYLERFCQLLAVHQERFAKTISEEMGKPLWEAKTEVQAMIGKLPISVNAYHQRTGVVVNELNKLKSMTRHKPHGVVAVLGPYNFPGHLPNGHIIPALLAGNTVVFKPSELTPNVAAAMMEIWAEAELPDGVINLLQGDAKIGQALLNTDINAVCFTGSYPTGLKIHQQFAGRPEVIVALEMGGNNPLLAFDIKNIEAAVYHTIQSSFITSGQRCSCARRLIIDKTSISDKFLDCLIEKTAALTIGSYKNRPEPFMGPLISQKAAQAVLDKEAYLLEKGASSLLKAQRLDAACLISPGIIDVSQVVGIEDEEIFGPLLQVYRVDSFAEAINIANQTKYGLSAGLLSDNPTLFASFYHQIKAGCVNFNRPLTGAASSAPFGGVGLSGNHRPSAYYAADYCAYPVASLESNSLQLPNELSPGINW